MLTKPHRQEALCRAYVQAIASRAGMNWSLTAYDYGMDLWIHALTRRGRRTVDTRPLLAVQFKSTTRASVGETQVTYDLEVKTYEDLRNPTAKQPRILVVLVLPEEERDWLDQSEEELTIRHCAYWVSLRGWGPTTATKTVRINISRSQVFSVSTLQTLMERLRQGAEL